MEMLFTPDPAVWEQRGRKGYWYKIGQPSHGQQPKLINTCEQCGRESLMGATARKCMDCVSSVTICSINNDDCSADRRIVGSGLCRAHRKRLRKYGDPHHMEKPRRRPGERCAVNQDCSSRPQLRRASNGELYCEKHYQRWRIHGDATFTTRQGMTDTPTYKTWEMMIQRCLNPNFTSWEYYGGRGITVCARWRSFENFLADMGERPAGRELDRIEVDGNYESANCRWATRSEQMLNTRKRAGTSSRYIGVSWDRAREAWRVYVRAEGKRHYLGQFNHEQEAARARDAFIIKHGIVAPLNLPEPHTAAAAA